MLALHQLRVAQYGLQLGVVVRQELGHALGGDDGEKLDLLLLAPEGFLSVLGESVLREG